MRSTHPLILIASSHAPSLNQMMVPPLFKMARTVRAAAGFLPVQPREKTGQFNMTFMLGSTGYM